MSAEQTQINADMRGFGKSRNGFQPRQFNEGVSHGLRTKWHATGAKQSEAHIVDGQINGVFRKWHENGVLSEEFELVANQPEGLSVAYFPSGFLRARAAMKNGKPIQQEFWMDGEKKE